LHQVRLNTSNHIGPGRPVTTNQRKNNVSEKILKKGTNEIQIKTFKGRREKLKLRCLQINLNQRSHKGTSI